MAAGRDARRAGTGRGDIRGLLAAQAKGKCTARAGRAARGGRGGGGRGRFCARPYPTAAMVLHLLCIAQLLFFFVSEANNNSLFSRHAPPVQSRLLGCPSLASPRDAAL
jgi:hypothetical protein